MTPGGPLPPPSGIQQAGPDPGAGTGAPPSTAPEQPDPGAMAQGFIRDAVTALRRVTIGHPDVLPDVRDVMVIIQTRVLPKILSSAPAPEPQVPPT